MSDEVIQIIAIMAFLCCITVLFSYGYFRRTRSLIGTLLKTSEEKNSSSINAVRQQLNQLNELVTRSDQNAVFRSGQLNDLVKKELSLTRDSYNETAKMQAKLFEGVSSKLDAVNTGFNLRTTTVLQELSNTGEALAGFRKENNQQLHNLQKTFKVELGEHTSSVIGQVDVVGKEIQSLKDAHVTVMNGLKQSLLEEFRKRNESVLAGMATANHEYNSLVLQNEQLAKAYYKNMHDGQGILQALSKSLAAHAESFTQLTNSMAEEKRSLLQEAGEQSQQFQDFISRANRQLSDYNAIAVMIQRDSSLMIELLKAGLMNDLLKELTV